MYVSGKYLKLMLGCRNFGTFIFLADVCFSTFCVHLKPSPDDFLCAAWSLCLCLCLWLCHGLCLGLGQRRRRRRLRRARGLRGFARFCICAYLTDITPRPHRVSVCICVPSSRPPRLMCVCVCVFVVSAACVCVCVCASIYAIHARSASANIPRLVLFESTA